MKVFLKQKKEILFFVFLFVSFHIQAQFQGQVYEESQTASVKQYGNTLLSPWVGGINSIQINHTDLNQDGKKDLVLYDHHNDVFRTFINVGNNGEIKYVYEPKYESNFPKIYGYAILKDYNCDGIDDLFERGITGVSVHKGYYQNNELKFTFFKDLYFPGQNGPVNVYIQPGDIPSIIDIDNDGDLDIFAYDVFGAYITFYKNMQVENGLPCDSIKMTLADNCWGKIYQTLNRAVNTNISCKGVAGQNKKSRHSGNTILHIDIDGDHDFDVIGGNISFNDAQVLYNNGSDIINAQDTNYNKTGHKLNMPYWPLPMHIDIDNDGKRDLLFSSHSDNFSNANYNCVAWYKNIGTDAAPNFIYQHDTLLVDNMIDVGAYSYPTFFDYDKDGRLDLFIGNEGVFNNSTFTMNSQLAYYRNTSTIGNISFELVTKDFLNLSAKNYLGIFPTFGDMTGDGISDLILGNAKGTIAIYKNFAANNNTQPNFQFFTDSMNNVFVDEYSFPVVYDFNLDGKSDLIIGDKMGYLRYYEDTSTAVNLKKMALKKDTLGNIKAGSAYTNFTYAAPFIGRMDNSSNVYLMLGNGNGNIERYHEDFKNNLGNFSRIDSTYSYISLPQRSVPAVADIDGDGMFDMVVGNKLGGLKYYKQSIVVGTHNSIVQKHSILLYPNPTNSLLNLLFEQPINNQIAKLIILDVTGNILYSEWFHTNTQNSFDISSLSSGMYLVEIEIKEQKIRSKFVKTNAN